MLDWVQFSMVSIWSFLFEADMCPGEAHQHFHISGAHSGLS